MSLTVRPNQQLPPPPPSTLPPPIPPQLKEKLQLIKQADRWSIVKLASNGVDTILKAIEMESKFEFDEALRLYISATEILLKSLKYRKPDESIYEIIRIKISQLINRAELLKKYIAGEPLDRLPSLPSFPPSAFELKVEERHSISEYPNESIQKAILTISTNNLNELKEALEYYREGIQRMLSEARNTSIPEIQLSIKESIKKYLNRAEQLSKIVDVNKK